MAYRKKNKTIVKNNISLKHELAKKQEQIEDKHQYIKEKMPKLFASIKNIIDSFDNEGYINMSSKDATYYVPTKQAFGKEPVKPLNNVEQTYKRLNQKLYQKIIARPRQTGIELQNKNINRLDKLNFSESRSYNNFTYQSVKEAMANIHDTGKAIVYDLETYGGTNKEGVWSPRGITEYSFQTVDVKGYKQAIRNNPDANILDHIHKETAVIGWTKEERDKWVSKIKNELANNGGEIKDEELRVTALRLQLYGNAEKATDANGITKVTKFIGNEAYIGGLDESTIEKGADFLHQAYLDAEKHKTASGLLPYHEKFFKTVSGVQKSGNTLIDFNGINFDMKIVNSQLSDLYYNTYGNNEQAQRAIATMFGFDANKPLSEFSGPGLHLNSNRRIDASGVFKTASDIAGLKAVYGNHYEEVLNDINKTRLNRQETYGEAMLKGVDQIMDKSLRHLAEQDTTVAALMSIMENENFKQVGDVGPNGPVFRHQSALENALEIIENAKQENKLYSTTIDQTNMGKQIFMSKGTMTTPGRSILNFTVDKDGTIKTASNYLIGEGNDHLKALGGIEKAGYNVSANPIKGLLYTVDDMFEVGMDSDLVKDMTKSMPEFASDKLVAVKLNTYLPDNLKEKYDQFDSSHYLFFTDKAEAEKYLSDTLDYIGEKTTDTSYIKDFDPNSVIRDRVQTGTEKAERVKYKKIRSRKEWDEAKKKVDEAIANGANIKPLEDFQTKTASRTITKTDVNGKKYKEKVDYQISNGKNFAPEFDKEGKLVYETYDKPVFANGVVIGKDGKPINEKDLYTKVEHEGIKFVNKNAEESITYVDVNKDLVKLKDTINADGTTEKIKVAEKETYNKVYNYLDETLSKKAEERATNAFNRNTYKSSRNFDELLKQMFPNQKEIDPNQVKDKLKEARKISHELSKDVSSGKALTAKTLKDRLGYDLIGTLGFNSNATNEKHLISSTLNNFIESTEKYVELNDVFKEMRGAINVRHKDTAATIKFDSMLNYMLDKFAINKYNNDYLTDGTLKRSARLTEKEMKNLFEVNVESFIDPRNVENLQHNIGNTLFDKNIARINLKGSPGTLSKDVAKMLYQNRGNTVDANAHEAFAMRKFVEHMHKQNPEAFENNPTLKNLIGSIKEEKAMAKFDNKFNLSTTEAAGKYIAEELIRGLKEYKEDAGYDKGIIRKTFNNTDLLNNESLRKEFVKYVKGNKDVIDEAYKNTANIKRYDFKTLNEFKPSKGKSAMEHIDSIVDDIFMPTVKGLKGDEALAHIKGNSNFNKVQKEYMDTLWKKTREAHIDTVTQIAQLVQNTGGILATVDNQLVAVHNDQVVAFKDLAKTRFDYGTLYHNIGSTNIVAKMQLGIDSNNKNILESNLVNVTPTLKRNKYIVEKAKQNGEWRPELINNFKGKVTNKMREESVISTFNAHERKRQFEIDFATEDFGKRLGNLVGVNDTKAVWGDKQTLTDGTIKLIKEEIERLGTRFDPENLSPQIIEALGKEMPYLLSQDVNTSDELKKYLPHLSASAKDKDMSKHITYVVDEDRYAQTALNAFDNPQRPTLQAGKIDYAVDRTEKGLEKYAEMTDHNKMVSTGTIFNTHDSNRVIEGKAVGKIDSAITVKKANAGNLAVRSIIENEYKKVMDDNSVSEAVKKEQAKMFALLYEVPNLQEQEKIMDARLMDTVFNQSANTQYISHKDLVTYYKDFDSEAVAKSPKNKLDKSKQKQAKKLINTIEGNMIKISKDEQGRLVVNSPSGSIVKRGDTIMNYYDRYSSGTVSSKIDIGRFQHGVFEKAGNIRLTDDQIKAYLESNLDVKNLDEKTLKQKAYEILDQEFNFKFFVSDIEQQSYGKYMDGAVEKDMTNGLYVKLGQLDESVRERVSKTKYKGISGKELLDKVLKVDEIEEIFKSDQQLIKDIKKERYSLSKKMFDEFDAFKDVSLIANHQTDKHKNYGLITEGVIGNIHEKLMSTGKAKDKDDATKILMNKLSDYDVFDRSNTKLEIKDGAIFIKPVDDKAAQKVVNKYKMHGEEGENILEHVRTLNTKQLKKMMSEDEVIGSLGLYHPEVKLFDANAKENVVLKDVYGDLAKIKSGDKDLFISKSYATLQQAVDPETMTAYDYQTVKALGIKRKAEREAIEANMYVNKKLEKISAQGTEITDDIIEQVKRERGFKKHFDKARELHAEADFVLGDMENISKVKTIGRQEMRIYNNKVFNFATENVANNYLKSKEKGTKEYEEAKDYIDKFYAGILKNNGNDHYELIDEFKGKGVYENITKDIVKQKIFKEGDIEITDDILTYGGKGYLKDSYNKIKKFATQELQEPDPKVSLRYAEELFQADSANLAYKFNTSDGHVSLEAMEKKGFKIVGLGDQSHLKEGIKSLNTVGETSAYGLNSIFTNNTLLYLGEDIAGAGVDNPAGYLAIPKAGKVLENNTISTMFQNKLKALNETYAEYQKGEFVHGSTEQQNKLQNLKDMTDNIKELIRTHTYDKEGAIHDLGKYEMDEAFRLKFSFANNSHMISEVGNQDIISDIINQGDAALKVAKINGKSIYDLEKQGAFLDYAFVGSNIFEKLGYFEDEKLQSLGKYDKKTGALEYINAEGKKRNINLNISKDREIAIEDMKQHLKENGIVANTGRYPMIMDDSDKATRIFLNDGITTKNRARVSVATALSMNADNDGDSASFGVFKLASGKTYNDYQMAKIQAERQLENPTINDIKNHILKNTDISEYDYKAFRSLDAELANAAIGKNKFYNDKSLNDVRGELITAVKNGTLNETMDSYNYKNLYQGMMYANAGSTQNIEALQKNANRIDSFVSKVSAYDDEIAKLRRIDIGEHSKLAGGEDMASYFDKVIGAVGNYDEDKGKFILNKQAREAGITEESVENFRQHAVARTRWFDSLKEAQSKSRKGSIGPVNVGMQGIRAAGEVLYSDANDVTQVQKKNIANWVAYELEEEVIGAKHGSVVNNTTKAKDLNSLIGKVINGDRNNVSTPHENMQNLKTWLNGGVKQDGAEIEANLSDKAVNNIWKRLETSGIVTNDNLPKLPTANMSEEQAMTARRRSYVVQSLEDVLHDISTNEEAKAAMKANKVGGTGATAENVVGRKGLLTLDSMTHALLDQEGLEDSITKRVNSELADSIPIAHGSTGSSGAMMEAGAKMSNKVLKLSGGKGLALTALGIAGMTLAAGYAGGPLAGGGASARDQEVHSKDNNTVPMMMDQSNAVVRNSNRGYIINIKANSNQDMRQTKRAMRQAAQAASGGVNVNMTVRNKDTLISDNDIEQFLTGL